MNFWKALFFVLVCTQVAAAEKYAESSFTRALESGNKVLVQVHADWCPTCKAQQKNLTGLTEGIRLFEVNFDEDKGFLKRYNVIQQSTLLAFNHGAETGRKSGITSKDDLTAFIAAAFGSGSLQAQLDQKRNSSTAPEDVRKKLQSATQKLEGSGIIDGAIAKGKEAIDFDLPNARGGKLRLRDALKKGPVVLTFYRGGWCPYCNIQLRAYQEKLPEIRALGGQLVAVSPESFESAESTVKKNELEFDVLSDAKNVVARKYGLVFKIGDDLKAVYQKFGIDLEKNQKNGDWELPVPATYVIAPDGKIVYSFLNVDYVKRAEPEEILSALRSLQ